MHVTPVLAELIFRILYEVLALLILFQFKHFLADYPLQGQYMLGKFKGGWAFVLPLTAHCAVHAALTGLIVWPLIPWRIVLVLMCFDFLTHFLMDRIKASPRLLGRFKALTAADMENLNRGFAPFQAGQSRYVDLQGPEARCGVEIREISKDEADRHLLQNKFFWWSLGLDQMVHHLTHYVIIFVTIYFSLMLP